MFPGVPELYARYEDVELLRDAISGLDAVVVAVGAGTLNDLAKRACGELGRPYSVVGTAASMDGYTAGTSRVGRRPFQATCADASWQQVTDQGQWDGRQCAPEPPRLRGCPLGQGRAGCTPIWLRPALVVRR